MTGTDECRNSRGRSRTPTRGNDPVPQPIFVGSAGGFVPPLAQMRGKSSLGQGY
jgi:hypothetical protein